MSDRPRGLLRWEEYLEGRLSPHGLVREDPDDFLTDDAVWRVGFRDDTRARIHVTDRAVRLSEEEFEETTDQLERIDWLELLEAARPGGIRIHADGGIDEVDPGGGGAEGLTTAYWPVSCKVKGVVACLHAGPLPWS